MKHVTTAAASRETDRYLIEVCGIPGIILMENAAFAVTDEVLSHEGNVLVLCGPGNNGGDGFAVLRMLKMRGRRAVGALFGDSNKISGDALINYRAATGSGCTIVHNPTVRELKNLIAENDIKIIVDAIFGTGLTRDLGEYHRDILAAVNNSRSYRIAVDVPSGVNSDTGRVCGAAFCADCTITFQTIKRGQIMYPGREMCGIVKTAPIGCAEPHVTEYLTERSDLRNLVPKRIANSHKGTYGKTLIIGGAEKYAGAAAISAVSALRGGAGLVRAVCSGRAAQAILAQQPEIMTVSCDRFGADIPDIDSYVEWSDCIAAGSGAGDDEGFALLLKKLILSGKKLIIDADGINCIARNRELLDILHTNIVLTPHVGEFSRLSGLSADDILSDMYDSACAFARKYNVNLLLKSSVSIAVSPDGAAYWICAGNSGLAKGGSGDSLSGLAAAFSSGGLDVLTAAYTAALFQGTAAEMCRLPENSVTISDISGRFAEVFDYIGKGGYSSTEL